MLRELKCTLRFFDHVGDITLKYFELRLPELAGKRSTEDPAVYRAYYKDLISDKPAYSDLTEHQKYLHDLQGPTDPVIASHRIRTRVPRLQPRTRSLAASSHLEDAGRRLAFESYHFKERLRLVSRSCSAILPDQSQRTIFQRAIGKTISSFETSNRRLLKYRNFIVHGPAGRTDEFADLRSWELGGILYHPDLWYDYNNAFWTAQGEWTNLAKMLIASMESCLLSVQSTNERLIKSGSFNFCRQHQ
jgi:hypothetical protein